MPPPELKIGEPATVVLGDDLGVKHFVYTNARLDFLNIPYLSQIGARVFSSAEAAYYP